MSLSDFFVLMHVHSIRQIRAFDTCDGNDNEKYGSHGGFGREGQARHRSDLKVEWKIKIWMRTLSSDRKLPMQPYEEEDQTSTIISTKAIALPPCSYHFQPGRKARSEHRSRKWRACALQRGLRADDSRWTRSLCLVCSSVCPVLAQHRQTCFIRSQIHGIQSDFDTVACNSGVVIGKRVWFVSNADRCPFWVRLSVTAQRLQVTHPRPTLKRKRVKLRATSRTTCIEI